MATPITVPEVAEGVTEGTVISLAVAEGDVVESDQTLLELETDKAVVALPAPFAGKITAVKVGEGDTVTIGQTVMECEPDGAGAAAAPPAATEPEQAEAPPEPAETTAEPEAQPDPAPVPEAAAAAAPTAVPEPPTASPPPVLGSAADRSGELDLQSVRTGDQVAPAAPSVRRLARELGADIYQVRGSGPGGRISEEDVRIFVKSAMSSLNGHQADFAAGTLAAGSAAVGAVTGAGSPVAATPLPDFSRWGEIERQPMNKIREITATTMTQAWITAPMVTQYDKADITAVEEFRKETNRTVAPEAKLTMTAILLKVAAAALRAFPHFNASVDMARKELILKKSIHIGVAVDTEHGLLVPVVRDVDHKGIGALAGELNDLAKRTRERKVTPDELEGAGFAVSNLGGIGGTAFTPLVYAHLVAILGVSRAETAPVWDGQEFRPRLMMPLSLTYDHRAIDGADGARFLRWICRALEQPLHLVMEG